MAEKFGVTTFRANLHKTTAEKFRGLISDLESTDKLLDSRPVATQSALSPGVQLSLKMSDIEDLPEELLAELNLSDADKAEFEIASAIEEAGGVISLDRLLIALYKRTGEIHKRTSLYSRLNRMAGKNMIHYVPGKKGVYSTEQLSGEDVLRLFGTAKSQVEDDD